jgi:hypothetical protein
MNRKLVAKVATFFAIVLAVASSAFAEGGLCNDKLIAGVYGFTLEGTKLAGAPGTPLGSQVGVAMTQFDGKGGLTQIDSVTIGGIAVSDFTHSPATGSYTVNSDCTGNFQLIFTDGRPPVTADFVVVEGGLEIDTVVTSAGGKQGILATRSIGKRQPLTSTW